MRLSSLVPAIPSDVVSILEGHGIRTETDFLFSAPIVEIYRRLPPNTVTLQELIDYRTAVAGLCAAPGRTGLELYELEKLAEEERRLLVGNEEFDAFLQGLGGGKIIEISGDKRAGKSTLALNLLLHHLASNPEDRAVWIDTSGEFSPEKALQILSAKQIAQTTLERIEVSLSFDIDMAQGLVEGLQERSDVKFLVIDSITPLLGPLLNAVSAQGHAVMSDFMRRLHTFAHESSAAVVVVNNTAGNGPNTNERKPALGPSFSLMPDTTLWLQAGESEGAVLHTIQILKSRSKPIGASLDFRIQDNVIYAS